MSLVVIGVKQDVLDNDIRESIVVTTNDAPKHLIDLCGNLDISEAIILSTCLRTEVYAVLDRFHPGVSEIEAWFAKISNIDLDTISNARFIYFDDDAIRHLFEVAAGLDSFVLGEGEVLTQVRKAGEISAKEGMSGPILKQLFKHAIEVGKRIRTETKISNGVTSVASASLSLLNEHVKSLSEKEILIVGAGQMGESIASNLSKKRESRKVTISNRSRLKGTNVANRYGFDYMNWANMKKEFNKFDVVFVTTAALEPVITLEMLKSGNSSKSGGLGESEGSRVRCFVDLGVPKNVSSEVGLLENVQVFDMENLKSYVDNNRLRKNAEVDKASKIISEEVKRFKGEVAARGAAPLVASLRSKGDQIRLSTLNKYDSKLRSMNEDERDLVEKITSQIVATLLHEPSVKLKETSGSSKGERLKEAVRVLFDLA